MVLDGTGRPARGCEGAIGRRRVKTQALQSPCLAGGTAPLTGAISCLRAMTAKAGGFRRSHQAHTPSTSLAETASIATQQHDSEAGDPPLQVTVLDHNRP